MPTCWIIAGPNGAGKTTFGGHHIADRDILRRFPRSLHNLLHLYAPAVSRARCLLNASGTPQPVFEQHGDDRFIVDTVSFNALLKEAQR